MKARILYVLPLTLAIAAGCAGAPAVKREAANGFDPFRLPGAVLMCRVKALPPSTPTTWLSLEFEDGSLNIDDRLIGVVYDSLGAPRVFGMTATERAVTGEPVMHGYRISFPDSAPPTAIQAVIAGPGQPLPRTKPERLSVPEIAEAHYLMVWLWNHRCKGGEQ